MPRDYQEIVWDEAVVDDCRQLVRLAVREDLGRFYDWTTVALVDADTLGSARVVARAHGVMAGTPAIALVAHEYDPAVAVTTQIADGQRLEKGTVIAELSGPARSLLAAERPLLNLLGHLAGIATVTDRYVQAAAGKSRIYDTRKTLPGFRRLEKYAVRCGGAFNHRLGLFDGVLIKDNHLALGTTGGMPINVASVAAIRRARAFIEQLSADELAQPLLLEIEVENLEALAAVLDERPDIVLLDNMSIDMLQRAVALRNERAPQVELEASGGIRLENIADIAATGVDRISVGALTHSAQWLDVALDWS
ncbi:MAG TPA: carboxylating nicotinate-nucleotide diphosphorylase [Pirellulales bacterium]|nr:carboxylating nicotinate-nucleotide diphosphorylase [Pirellulales bacterium]